MPPNIHLQDELLSTSVKVKTRYGPVVGRRAMNGAAAFLEIPYALPPKRFEDPVSLPDNFRYEQNKTYTEESTYAVQPMNDGQARDIPVQDKLGLGNPSENPLFLNIVAPPSFPSNTAPFPVKVYIHGGFLQFGSPHGLTSQAQYVAAERSELWINVGYRVSAFGFLASNEISGNFGFKDQWLALKWIKDNCVVFGGNPDDIQIIGLSAGAHSVHQLLHHASQLPPGQQAPFTSAVLQSNAILMNPQSPAVHHAHYVALCLALNLDPASSDTLPILRDPAKVPWRAIAHLIESTEIIPGSNPPVPFGTFRGCLSPDWLGPITNPMEHQRTGGLARGLREHGVKSVVVGEVKEEWYLYAIAHSIRKREDIEVNLRRYIPDDVAKKLIEEWDFSIKDGEDEAVMLERVFGEMLGVGQVHLPVRILARDLIDSGFPVVRYVIEWTPEQGRPHGYITHGTDRPLWAFRLPLLQGHQGQVEVARAWLEEVDACVKAVEDTGKSVGSDRVLVLKGDRTIGWEYDARWDEMMRLGKVLCHGV